jgi:ABC-2 type transport system permease protein
VRAYFVALMAVQMLTVCYEANTLLQGITNGDIANDLLRPHPSVIQVLGNNLAWRGWHVALGTPVVIAAAMLAGATFDPPLVALAVPAVVIAALLRFLFSYVLVLTALWTERAGSVVAFGHTLVFLLGGAAAPITLFPEWARPFGEALPMRGMLGFPAEIAAGGLAMDQVVVGYGWQVAWTVLFSALAAVTWRAGVRRYVAIGS